ncbi:hAT dimerisation domain-containing protein [Striga hermonthica]|uniref:HAT dimerisation domain-containing protein n=1 Tax=Striga hermonthica TaxID=68872 RepID=A0A9N7NXX0_STRHE|nr:hAT dimerisation domain-containing protein [Striga hermonthica]
MSDAVSSRLGSRSNNTNDIGWKLFHAPNDGDTNIVVSNYCDKIMKGEITRVKNHLMGRKGYVAACKKCPVEVREELWAYVKTKTNTGDTNYVSIWDSDDDTPLPPPRKNAAELKGIGSFGPHLRTASFHEITVPLLNNEVDYTKNLMEDHEAE